MMTLDDYAKKVIHTLIYPGSGEILGLAYVTLGLTGEAGEVAEKVKKILRDGDGTVTKEQKELLKLELGDIMWYIGAAAHELGFSLDEIAQANIDKLDSRKKRDVLKGSGDTR